MAAPLDRQPRSGGVFTALDSANPADFGMATGGESSGAREGGGAEGRGGDRRPVDSGVESDGWDQGPDDGVPRP